MTGLASCLHQDRTGAPGTTSASPELPTPGAGQRALCRAAGLSSFPVLPLRPRPSLSPCCSKRLLYPHGHSGFSGPGPLPMGTVG